MPAASLTSPMLLRITIAPALLLRPTAVNIFSAIS
jgi:hypothetical protein